MQTFRQKLFDDVVNRLKTVYDFASDREVADYIGVSKAVLSAWRQGKSRIDYELILEKCPELRPGWIIDGSGYPFFENRDDKVSRRYLLKSMLDEIIRNSVILRETEYYGDIIDGLEDVLNSIFEVIGSVIEYSEEYKLSASSDLPEYLISYFNKLDGEKYCSVCIADQDLFLSELINNILFLPDDYQLAVINNIKAEHDRVVKKKVDNILSTQKPTNNSVLENVSLEELFQNYLEQFIAFINNKSKDYKIEKK